MNDSAQSGDFLLRGRVIFFCVVAVFVPCAALIMLFSQAGWFIYLLLLVYLGAALVDIDFGIKFSREAADCGWPLVGVIAAHAAFFGAASFQCDCAQSGDCWIALPVLMYGMVSKVAHRSTCSLIHMPPINLLPWIFILFAFKFARQWGMIAPQDRAKGAAPTDSKVLVYVLTLLVVIATPLLIAIAKGIFTAFLDLLEASSLSDHSDHSRHSH